LRSSSAEALAYTRPRMSCPAIAPQASRTSAAAASPSAGGRHDGLDGALAQVFLQRAGRHRPQAGGKPVADGFRRVLASAR
jgi:hypothetical protein